MFYTMRAFAKDSNGLICDYLFVLKTLEDLMAALDKESLTLIWVYVKPYSPCPDCPN